MVKYWFSALVSLSLLASSTLSARGVDYRCTVERVETARPSDSEFHQAYVGREFTVERASGVMVGALKNNYVSPPQVIDPGSAENSYKVLGSLSPGQGLGPGSNVYLLTINEYDASERKPFLFAQNDAAYFGHCTHF